MDDDPTHVRHLGMKTATIERIENYGLYMRSDDRLIIVLITDISEEPIRSIQALFHIGQTVQVDVERYIPSKGLYKGWMRKNPRGLSPGHAS